MRDGLALLWAEETGEATRGTCACHSFLVVIECEWCYVWDSNSFACRFPRTTTSNRSVAKTGVGDILSEQGGWRYFEVVLER